MPFHQELEDLDGALLPMDVEGYKRLARKAINPQDLPEHGRGSRLNRFRDILPNPGPPFGAYPVQATI